MLEVRAVIQYNVYTHCADLFSCLATACMGQPLLTFCSHPEQTKVGYLPQ